MLSFRDDIYQYVNEKYQSDIEFPWFQYPSYAVARHEDNRKWYILIMEIPRSKLGLEGEERVKILNVKLLNPLERDSLIENNGFFPGYHISSRNWMTILLDGTVPFSDICTFIDESYIATASKETKERLRPPKDWLIPANPAYYDVEQAFRENKVISWKQGRGIKTGDTVYMYVGAPVSAILYQCLVKKTEIPYLGHNENVNFHYLMEIERKKQYPHNKFTFEVLKNEYGIRAVRGPRGIPEKLKMELEK